MEQEKQSRVAALRPLFFTDEPLQQMRLTIWAVGAFTSVLYSAIQGVEVHFGLMDETQSNALIAAMLGSACFFYAAIRNRWTLGLRRSDPSLTLVQKRRRLMREWAAFCATPETKKGSVISMKAHTLNSIF